MIAVDVHEQSLANLAQIRTTLDKSGLGPRSPKHRKKNADQNRDDSDNNKELNKSESRRELFFLAHRIVPFPPGLTQSHE